MKDYLDQLKSELKRADHLFFVSLKYTRTVDVIRSVLDRLMNAYYVGFEALLVKAKRRRKIDIPEQPRKRCELLKEIFSDDKYIIASVDFYLEMRDIIQAKYDKREEYRRHVTMITHLEPGRDIDVNIDLLQEYYAKTRKFEEYLLEKLG